MPDVLLPPAPDAAIGWAPNSNGPTSSAVIVQILAMTYAQIAAAILSGGGCIWVSRLLSTAEINALNSAPIVMVSAVGLPAATIIQPVYSAMEERMGVTTYSAAPSLRGRWAGIANDVIMVDGFTNIANTYLAFLNDIESGSLGAGLDCANLDMELSAVADTTLGSGTARETLGYCLSPGL